VGDTRDDLVEQLASALDVRSGPLKQVEVLAVTAA
jgi:hypothetical protein